MVHNLPDNFNISDFDVFHSALLYIHSIFSIFNSTVLVFGKESWSPQAILYCLGDCFAMGRNTNDLTF